MSTVEHLGKTVWSPDRPLKIGARGSVLALAQAEEVKERIVTALDIDSDAVTIRTIKTTGDRLTDRPLSEVGGKGLFTKEIEQELISKRIDMAVHSAKDMPTVLPSGLVISAYLKREDVRDAFVCDKAESLETLPAGSVVGTASLRRQAQVLRFRRDLKVVMLRGNVQTRLKKLGAGQADATLLAVAGLNRLKLRSVMTSILDPDQFLPACAQGAICIETRVDDELARMAASQIHHGETAELVEAERSFLNALEGSCRMPIGGMASLDGDQIKITGEILSPDGKDSCSMSRRGPRADGIGLGREMGLQLRSRMARLSPETVQSWR